VSACSESVWMWIRVQGVLAIRVVCAHEAARPAPESPNLPSRLQAPKFRFLQINCYIVLYCYIVKSARSCSGCGGVLTRMLHVPGLKMYLSGTLSLAAALEKMFIPFWVGCHGQFKIITYGAGWDQQSPQALLTKETR
jgi:hypothetical protein